MIPVKSKITVFITSVCERSLNPGHKYLHQMYIVHHVSQQYENMSSCAVPRAVPPGVHRPRGFSLGVTPLVSFHHYFTFIFFIFFLLLLYHIMIFRVIIPFKILLITIGKFFLIWEL